MRSLLIIGVVVVIIIIAVMVMNRDDGDLNINLPDLNNSTTTNNNNSTTTNATSTATTTQGAVREFAVSGSPFKFNPATIRVKQGDVVRVTFKNTQGQHNWVLDEFDVSTKILAAGAQETVQFTASRKGSFEYYCSVGNHREQGMRGTLIVE